MKEFKRERIIERIQTLKLELNTMNGNYYDGWTTKGMKEELALLEAQLEEINNKKK